METLAQEESRLSKTNVDKSAKTKSKPLNISWSKSPNAIKYQIQVSLDSLFTNESIIIDQEVKNNSIMVHKMGKKEEYYYRTRFATKNELEINWSDWSPGFMADWYSVPPKRPVITGPRRDPEGSTSYYSCVPGDVNWQKVDNATEYQIY